MNWSAGVVGSGLAIALGSGWPTGIEKQAKGFRDHRIYSRIRWKPYPLPPSSYFCVLDFKMVGFYGKPLCFCGSDL